MLDSFLYFTLSGSKSCLFEILGLVLLKVMMQGLLFFSTRLQLWVVCTVREAFAS